MWRDSDRGERRGRVSDWRPAFRREADRDVPSFVERLQERRMRLLAAQEAERDRPARFAERRFFRDSNRDDFDDDFDDDDADGDWEARLPRRPFAAREDAEFAPRLERFREERARRFAARDEAESAPRLERFREERARRFAARPFSRPEGEEGPIARIVRRIDPETVGRIIERFAEGRPDVDVDVGIGRGRMRNRDLWNGWDSPEELREPSEFREPSRDTARELQSERERNADVGRDNERGEDENR
jgi:hypothetical protein